MKSRQPKVSVEFAPAWAKVTIDGVLHLKIRRDTLLGLQSWVGSDGSFYIEFTMSGGAVISADYRDRGLWESILRGFDNEE